MTCEKKDSAVAENEDLINNETACENESKCENSTPEVVEELSEVDKLSLEVSVWQDKYIRLAAEFDNFRKRTLKEKLELVEYSGEDVIKAILPVFDDMERASAANEKVENAEIIKQGMTLIQNKMADVLKHKGVIAIEAIGEVLDTDLHDAIAKVPVDQDEKRGCVIDVVEKGYKFKDKVIRFSKVVVGE